MTAKTVNRKKKGGERSGDAGDRNALIEALKERNLVLEKELQTRHEELSAQVDELRRKNDALEGEARERKQVEETLELTRFSMDHASDCIFWLKPDGGFHDVNEAPCKLLGYSREELLQMSVWDIDPDIDRKKFRELWEDTRRHGSIVFETRMRAKDGTVYPVEVTGNCLVFGDREYVFAFVKNITERKRAEEALRKNERYLENIFESFQEGISILDTGLNIVKANRAMEKWYSHMLPLVGKKCYHAYQKRTEACENCPSLRAMKEKTMQMSVVPYIDRNDHAGWMELYSFPLLDEQGNVMGVIEHVRDITQRKKIEEALRESEETFRALAESSSAAITIIRDDKNVYINRAAATMLGYSIDELLKMRPLETVYPDDREMARETIIMLERGEKTRERLELRMLRKDGYTLWADISAAPICYRGKTALITIALDTTDRKLAEEAVKLANAYNRSLIEVSLDPLVTISPEGVITDVNKATEKVTGYSREELIGTDFSCYFTEPEKAKEGYMEAFTVGSVRDYPLEIRNRNGHVTPVIYNASVYRDEKGKVIGVFAAARDITARRRAEQGLKEAKAEAELYLDLMGHDIRNMNQIGMGFLEMAMASPDISKHDKELLLKSLGSMENSTRLIDNVRKLQKARSGEMKRYEVDACQTFLRVLAHFSNMPGVRASYNYEIPPTCPVMANELLYEVFENLVGNAIKHGGPEPAIDVRFDRLTADGRMYNRFTVEDNGPGIPDDMKCRIFNRLQRGDSKAKGTGLGLYLVRSLVESYGGRVWVEDRVQGDYTKGAKFVVILPAE